MINKLLKGIVQLDSDLVIDDSFSREKFMRSHYFMNQDLDKIFFLDKHFILNSHLFAVSLFFGEKYIYMIELVCLDQDFSPETEREREKLHNKILQSWSLKSVNYYSWGSIISGFDKKSNISSINIIFKENRINS